MPKKPPTLHPLLGRAVEETVGGWCNPGFVGAEGKAKRLVLQYWTLGQKSFGGPLLVGVLGGFALFILGAILMGAALVLPSLLCGLGSILMVARMAWRLHAIRFASPEEIATVLPILALTRVQRSAFEAWFALEDSSMPEAAKSELRAGLDRLVDEEARLRTAPVGGLGSATRPEAIEAERDALRERLAGTADPGAWEALAHVQGHAAALEVAEVRATGAGG